MPNSIALKSAVVATLAYHEALDYPLTAWEVFQRLLDPGQAAPGLALPGLALAGFPVSHSGSENFAAVSGMTYGSVLSALQDLTGEGVAQQEHGFYLLRGGAGSWEERIERTKVAEHLWRQVRPALRLLTSAPFVSCVMLSGSLAASNAKPSSDVDLLVIASENRIWTARSFLTLLGIFSLRLRPGRLTRFCFPLVRYAPQRGVAGKLCLNHYLTVTSLALRSRSLFTAASYLSLVPLWGETTFADFVAANSWIRKYFPTATFSSLHLKAVKGFGIHRMARRCLEAPLRGRLGDFLEWLAGAAQRHFIRGNPLTKRGGRVVAEDSELAFHPETPEEHLLERFRSRMRELALPAAAPDS